MTVFVTLLCLAQIGGVSSVALVHRSIQNQRMQPEVVARTLMEVEGKWKNEALSFLECNASSPHAPGLCLEPERAFQHSCTSVMGVVVKASAGDRSVVNEYMQSVCSESILQGWTKASCLSFASTLGEGMTDDSYTNRQDLNLTAPCTNLWQSLAQGEANRMAKEAEERAAYEKKLAEERAAAERKAAEERAQAQKKAAEERTEAEKKAAEEKAIAEKKAAEEKARAAEQARKRAEEEAKKMAEEATKKAAAAAQRAAEAKKNSIEAAAKVKLQNVTAAHKSKEAHALKAVVGHNASQTGATSKMDTQGSNKSPGSGKPKAAVVGPVAVKTSSATGSQKSGTKGVSAAKAKATATASKK